MVTLDTLACNRHIQDTLVPGNTSGEYNTGDNRKGGDPDDAAEKPAWVDAGGVVRPRRPVAVDVYERGRRARCLRCLAVGPVREDADSARRALVEERAK